MGTKRTASSMYKKSNPMLAAATLKSAAAIGKPSASPSKPAAKPLSKKHTIPSSDASSSPSDEDESSPSDSGPPRKKVKIATEESSSSSSSGTASPSKTTRLAIQEHSSSSSSSSKDEDEDEAPIEIPSTGVDSADDDSSSSTSSDDESESNLDPGITKFIEKNRGKKLVIREEDLRRAVGMAGEKKENVKPKLEKTHKRFLDMFAEPVTPDHVAGTKHLKEADEFLEKLGGEILNGGVKEKNEKEIKKADKKKSKDKEKDDTPHGLNSPSFFKPTPSSLEVTKEDLNKDRQLKIKQGFGVFKKWDGIED
ncbi:uncharacterized protein LY89DRAFT_742357 [Mollisia scopiformis]|uniref:Uncharacterized protein n=1 Tax=Mollisia scopiformis TaxID=149040 RepID=A0A132B859_MOLSC|nr:uncharacterized protein LY89DRAFT_742357 [Mollisia scopiformis]KUJ08064.1 hypothetical protein LY89DRAFT_742357 [Mollisia scopiformis]